MSAAPRILGVITARGGSKGILGKNIKELGGKPLIAYTIAAAQGSALITDLVVSTDDPAIAEVARAWGAAVPFMRPAELAEDSTPHLPVMQHAIRFMEAATGAPYDYAVILQPTSPLRLPEDIDKTLEALIASSAESAVSLVEVATGEHPIKAKKLEGGRVLPYALEEPEGLRRQEIPMAYRRSGAVYAMARALLMERERLYGDHIVGHVVPRERSVDIDDMLDWLKAEYLLEKLRQEGYAL